MMSVKRGLAAVIFSVVSFGCAGGAGPSSTPDPVDAPTEVPAGVDSLVAVLADSLADESFVEEAEQDEALCSRRKADFSWSGPIRCGW